MQSGVHGGQGARRAWIRQGVISYGKEFGCILSKTGIHEL